MKGEFNVLINAAFKYCELSKKEIETLKELYKLNGQKIIYEFAKTKKILPFVAVLMCKSGFDKDFWFNIAEEYRRRNEFVIEQLNMVFNKFSENNVKKAFVTENFGAFLSADADKALFASGDADLYVDISEKEKIYKAFNQLGYTIEERFSHKKLISSSFYNNDILPDGFYFGVAWNPLSRMKLPSFIEADEFVKWAELRRYKDMAIMLPDIDALMYICLLHISLHSFSRAPDIRLYIDINNVSQLPVNWENIIGFAKRDKTMVRLLVACILANKLLSVNIPDFVLELRKKYNASVSKLINMVYDEERNCLKYEPKGMKILYIEALADDKNIYHGIKEIIFPDKKWVKEFYVGQNGNIITGYLKHIKNLL